ncbi:hypothetical protein [Agrobacterium sp. B1(2019)]|uniref:hypothetical protein n=1 Tax=Agrobacterium sp. B1(2019) TaxID=2607032 RepID=UPI0011EFBF66|nr:hypothetical protein [Agrobacterium sp. B1(2019)]TZG32147.1 hypothetical protein AGR1_24425 [Agrobacterium sp. B1(2019)]
MLFPLVVCRQVPARLKKEEADFMPVSMKLEFHCFFSGLKECVAASRQRLNRCDAKFPGDVSAIMHPGQVTGGTFIDDLQKLPAVTVEPASGLKDGSCTRRRPSAPCR